MRRDHDLFRKILLEIEASDHDPIETMTLEIPGYTEAQITYHVRLLDEAGFIEALDISTDDGSYWEPKRLTNYGHDFLDSIRDPKAWQYAKDVANKAGSNTVDFIFEAAKAYAKHKLKEMGLDF